MVAQFLPTPKFILLSKHRERLAAGSEEEAEEAERFGINDWEERVPWIEAERSGEDDLVRPGHCQSRQRGLFPGDF